MIVGDNSSRDSSTIETIEGTLTDSGAVNSKSDGKMGDP